MMQTDFKFEKREYKGVMTEFTKQMTEMGKEHGKDKPLEEKMLTMDNYQKARGEMEGMIDGMLEQAKEGIEQIKAAIDITEEKVTARDGAELTMYIYRPKTLESQNAPAYFYAHGGGAWALQARHVEGSMFMTAMNLECVVFNIEYRLAPEHKCPGGQADFVDCVLHGLANAAKFGINPDKAAIAGCSGGGWIVAGAANLMAKSNDLAKIKAVFIHTGMLSDSTYGMSEDQMDFYDKDMGVEPQIMTSSYKNLLATDWENQQNDDQLYPGRASDDILKMYPPTVVWTSEFDFLRRDNEVFAARLKAVGRLAELSEMPGSAHGYHQMGDPETMPEVKWFLEEEKMAFHHLVAK